MNTIKQVLPQKWARRWGGNCKNGLGLKVFIQNSTLNKVGKMIGKFYRNAPAQRMVYNNPTCAYF